MNPELTADYWDIHKLIKYLKVSSFYCEVLQKCCRVKTSEENNSILGVFRSAKIIKAQFPAIRITEQGILQTKRKINGQGCKFSEYFRIQISYSFSSSF